MSTWTDRALHTLREAMAGQVPPVEFLPAEPGGEPRWIQRPDVLRTHNQAVGSLHRQADPGTQAQMTHCSDSEAANPAAAEHPAVVVRTSGSTGTPKQTLLSAAALHASAQMTAEYLSRRGLGGHGQWLLTLQPSYVAGLAVLSRSIVAQTQPVALLENTTDPEAFAVAAEQLTAEHRYVSLVPTQLKRLLDHAAGNDDARLLAALQRFDAILLGGGASSTELIGAAESAGLHVVRTYGMSETCGGCVYDGIALTGTEVELDDDGRVLLSGPQVALGYLDEQLSSERFDTDASGQRRFRTDDLGVLTGGVLSITGRVDDVINTGGVKVSAGNIRQVLETDPAVSEAFVAGVADPEWGQQVAAVIALQDWPAGDFAPLPPGGAHEAPSYPPAEWWRNLSAEIRQQLGPAAVPKSVHYVKDLPRLSSGKPDRQAMIRMLSRAD